MIIHDPAVKKHVHQNNENLTVGFDDQLRF